MRKMQEAKQRELLDATFEAQEAEKKRLGSDIHDDIGPLLSTLKLNIARIRFCKTPHDVESQIKASNEQLNDAIQRVRTVSRALVPSVLTEFGLIAAIQDLCKRINLAEQIKANVESDVERIPWETKTQLNVYRMVQELTNNAIKHSEATQLDILFFQKNGSIEVVVEDNGKGLPRQFINGEATFLPGIGLKNIEARASLIEADFHFDEASEGGTKAILIVHNKE